MTTRYDVITPRDYTDREGQKRTTWTRIGAAWEKGEGEWAIQLDALPVSGKLLIKPPREQGEAPRRKPAKRAEQQPLPDASTATSGDDADIPF